MNRIILQVPMKKELRDQAEIAAKNNGFSSLQEVMRVFLLQFVENKIDVGFVEPPVQLSKRAVTRYNRIIKNIESGKEKTKSFTSVKALMDDLNA